MRIKTFQLGELNSNCYLVETAPGRCIAVDIGGSPRILLEYMRMQRLKLTKILLTHGHFDHMGGTEEVRAATGAEIYVHESDAPMLTSSSASLHSAMSIMPFREVTDFTVVRGDCCINDGDCSFRVLHTPGHTQGSVCFVTGDVIFSGDTLFCCSVGRTDFPGGNSQYMMNSMQLLRDLDGDYKVYPGHGESTTLEYERNNNPFMR